MASLLKVVGVLLMIAGVIAGFASYDSHTTARTTSEILLNVQPVSAAVQAVIYVISGIVSGAFFLGLGSILDALQDIRDAVQHRNRAAEKVAAERAQYGGPASEMKQG